MKLRFTAGSNLLGLLRRLSLMAAVCAVFFGAAGQSLLPLQIMAPAHAVPQTEAAGAGWSTVQKLVRSFHDEAKSESVASLDVPLAADLIDYRQIAMRSLAKGDWQSLNAAQQQDLTATIEALVQNRYYPRWKKIFAKGDVAFISEERHNGDIVVNTTLRLGQEVEPLTWLLASHRPRVISLAVKHNDLLTKLAQRIQARQARSGYPAMITWLKGKGKCDIADGDAQSLKSGDTAPLKTSAKSIDLID